MGVTNDPTLSRNLGASAQAAFPLTNVPSRPWGGKAIQYRHRQ